MRTDILDLHHFYETPLGQTVQGVVDMRLEAMWGEVTGMRVAGFGFTAPWLGRFSKARTLISLAPDAQGVMRWPQHAEASDMPVPEKNRACLVHEGFWPLPDRSLDRLLIVHGLEEVRDVERLMREAWRVLADDGRMIIVAAQRRGLWATFDTTPLAAGRPWLRGQLGRTLQRANFTPLVWQRALHFPPMNNALIRQSAGGWEKVGRRLWPGFCGLLVVEAGKSMMHPAKGTPEIALNVIRPRLRGQWVPAPRPASPLGAPKV